MTPELQPSTSIVVSPAAEQLHRKLAALGQDGYDLAACERFAAQIEEINGKITDPLNTHSERPGENQKYIDQLPALTPTGVFKLKAPRRVVISASRV